ncbi:proline dehydrogenase family protein [Gilvibacter sediminis]|uniref:proline dehydrogenase family protein n=1 Tax=Gilvibacter sediminis TaxID=379071 RepID=UPI0023502C23|nr:proline dehydrogenase family protein [Gilvibacter sediminis]MDC7998260.1 proline dehydrogenase family protein [Gilvibacter sediminis]
MSKFLLMPSEKLFENTEVAFALKTDSELERAHFLFKMIASEPLVKIGTAATKLALNMNLPVEGLIRSTVFDHFCGGVNEEDCLPVVDKLYEKGVHAVLDYSVEGKETQEQFNSTLAKVNELTAFADEKDAMPFSVFKPTGLGRFKIWEKKSAGETLTESEQAEWDAIVARYESACEKAQAHDVALLIDGEESWMQDAADELVTDMMRKHNKDKALIFNTLQCYRWDRLDYLKEQHLEARAKGFKLGYKIVRGAYMEKENERADENGYPTPICKDKAHTDQTFNDTLRYILENLEDISVFIGSHNEESCYLAMELMEELGIAKNDPRVWFGQLFGMSDHISYNLAEAGYNVAKYIPFGPVKDVMPYLIRRAEENTSVAGQTSRELSLLKNEKKRRKL